MTHAAFIAWAEEQAAAGKTDAMGHPFTSWLVARYARDGSALRDDNARQLFETQAEFKARSSHDAPVIVNLPLMGQTMDLFA
jgi:hypothetical protein